jgi:8-oxo-dGTP pyrophosphatase MutT (NUDIX family)
MIREFSAGGVVLRAMDGKWHIAAIEPRRDPEASTNTRKRKSQSQILALPKGLVDAGEKPEQTALREVQEETGVIAALVEKLTDIKYFYVRSWSDRERVFKVVSFYLLLYQAGNIDEISPDMRIEVRRALWLPLEEAPKQLAYKSERDVVKRAQQYVSEHAELVSDVRAG